MLTEDKWIIRGDTASDYETSADAYKAVLVSDIGTEMTLNSDYISWSVSGSDYISMKSPSGASSIMTAKQELPIGEHTITLKAEYEDEAGIKLEATKTITVEKRETSVPTQVNISGERALSQRRRPDRLIRQENSKAHRSARNRQGLRRKDIYQQCRQQQY